MNDEKNIKHIYIIPLALIYSEVMLRIFGKTGVLLNLIYPILFCLGTGLLLSFIAGLFKWKINRMVTFLLLTSAGVLFVTECLIHRSMQFYMPISTIGTMASEVTSSYAEQVAQTVLYSIPVIVAFLCPACTYFIWMCKDKKYIRRFFEYICKKYTFKVTKQSQSSTDKANQGYHLVCALFLLIFAVVWASFGQSSDKYKGNYQFDSATETFGLVSALQLELYYSIFPNEATEDFLVTEAADDSQKSDNDENNSAENTRPKSPGEEEEEIVYKKNIMDLDWEMISASSSDSIHAVNEYVQSIPASSQNEYTGLFKGKNLILICAEAFSHAVIDKSLTPTLYRLTHNGFYFSDYYQPSWNGSTSTGEYSMLMGIAPLKDVRTMPATEGNNLYFTMGNQLQRIGYSGNAYHNGSYKYYSRHLTHENLGYDDWIAQGNGLEDLASAWPSDLEMFEGTLPTYIDKQPFSVYYMSVSGHFPYKADDEKTREHLEYVQQKTGDKYDDKTQYYLAYQMELEYSLRYIVRQLEAKGIADDTVICITADHYPYGLEHSSTYGNKRDYIEDLYGYYPKNDWERDKNAWILWSGSLENEHKNMVCEVSEPTYSLDILPTLSNLFGLTYDSRLLVGRDVFSDTEPLVLWTNHSWVTDKGKYDAKTGVFYPEEGIIVDDTYIERINNEVSNKLSFSGKVLDYDYYNILFGE